MVGDLRPAVTLAPPAPMAVADPQARGDSRPPSPTGRRWLCWSPAPSASAMWVFFTGLSAVANILHGKSQRSQRPNSPALVHGRP